MRFKTLLLCAYLAEQLLLGVNTPDDVYIMKLITNVLNNGVHFYKDNISKSNS